MKVSKMPGDVPADPWSTQAMSGAQTKPPRCVAGAAGRISAGWAQSLMR